MRRTVDVEIDIVDGRPLWGEGTLEIGPAVATDYQNYAPLTMLEVTGEYFRPDRHTKILRVTTPPKLIATPLDRAAAAARKKDVTALARFLRVAADDTSPIAWTLQAVLAVHEGRATDARDAFLRVLCADDGLPVCEDFLAEVYFAVIAGNPASLDEAARRALVRHVYRDGRLSPGWGGWVHPLVASTYDALPSASSVPPPWHFGGPRVVTGSDHRSIVRWIRRWLESVASAEERIALVGLDGFAAPELETFCEGAELRDEKLEEEAREAATDEWYRSNPDTDDSSPDDLGDPGLLECDCIPYVWARFRCEADAGDADGHTIVHLLAEDQPPRLVRAFALALDATAILAWAAPDLASDVERVVFVDATPARGLAIVRMRLSGFCLLTAEGGAFGTWAVVSGTREQIRDAVPAGVVERATEAMSRVDDECDFVHADPLATTAVGAR